LKDVVLSSVEDLWIVTATLFNADGNIVGDSMRQNNLALGSWEKEGVEDLLSRCSDISPGNSMSGRVGV
jgi:hypothetical protein